MEEIEKATSFDNYILLTPPNEMVSLFGEYLRELMLRKLNHPELDILNGHIFGCTPDVFRKATKKYQEPVWEKEWKHRDVTKYMLRPLSDYTRREMAAI